MTNKLEQTLRMLEEATAAGDASPSQLDAETASLREAWLAFGQALEADEPPAGGEIRLTQVVVQASRLPCTAETAAPQKGSRVTAERSGVRLHWPLRATAALAATLLVGVAAAWMLYYANRNDDLPPGQQHASNQQQTMPQRVHPKQTLAADGTQWDDALDEQFQQISWQMLCLRENQTLRTDAFGRAKYQMEQLRKAIQSDLL
jgi:hypothetical protein